MGFVIGGDTAWKVSKHRDIGVAFHWFGADEEPTMFLYPLYRHLRTNGAVPYGIPLRNLHEIVAAGSKGEKVDSAALMEKAVAAAQSMGLGNEKMAPFVIADAILAHVDALCRMPPKPQRLAEAEKPSVGEVSIKVDGTTVYEGKA